MLKKRIGIVLLAVFLVWTFISCGSKSEAEPEPSPPGSSVPPTPPPAQPTYTVVANPSSYDVSAESIAVNITNTSQVEGGYGLYYQIERNVNGSWEVLPLFFAVPDVWIMIPAGQTNTEAFSLHQGEFDYQPGAYRIVFDNLGGAPAQSAQFTLS